MPAPRAAAHIGRPSSPATTAQTTVAATRAKGAMACLWMGSLLLARSFRLQIDRVQRQDEPGEHTDHREQRKGVHEPVDAGSAVSYTHLRAHETRHDLVCRL